MKPPPSPLPCASPAGPRSLFDDATNCEHFQAYVDRTLVPVLKPGDTVILDNLNADKVAGVREVIAAALPPAPLTRV